MATSYTLSLLLNAIDKASGPIKEVVNGLSQLGKSAQQATADSKETGTAGAAAMQNFRAAIAEARTEMQALAASAASVTSAAITLAATGAAISAAFLFPVKQAADFEHAMSQVIAITHGTQAEIKSLADEAVQLGLVTKFTSTEIAEGMNYMARAGLTASQMIAALPAVVALATASETSMAETSGLLVSIIKGMGIGITDLTHVTDVLAYSSTHANQSLVEIGGAMKFVAPAAKATSTDINSLAAMLDVLALSGIKGHMAGTQLRQMMVELAKPTTAAQHELRDMGIVVTDITGKLRPMIDILQDLKNANMDLEQAGKLFNARTATAVLTLADNIDEVKKLDAVNKGLIGTTQEMADIMVKNVIGAWVNFKATIQAFSEAVAGPLLVGVKAVIDGVNMLLQGLTKLAEVLQPLPAIFLAVVGTAGAFFIALGGIGLAVGGAIRLLGFLWQGVALLTGAGGFAAAAEGSTAFAAGLGLLSAAAAMATAAFEGLVFVFTATPWGAIATMIGLAGYALYKYATATQTAVAAAREQAQAAQNERAEFEETYNSLKKTTEGSREHNAIIAQLIARYPELATQLRLTNQTWAEQQQILDRFSTEKVVNEVEKIGAAAKATSLQIQGLSDKLNDPGLWEKIKALDTAIGAGIIQAFTGTSLSDVFVKSVTVALVTYKQLTSAALNKNQQDYKDAAVANAAAFQKMFDDMGIATKDWATMTDTQLQALWDSQTGGTAKFREALHSAFGDFQTFLNAVKQAQGETHVETAMPAAVKTAAEQAVSEANEAFAKLKLKDELREQLQGMATSMTETLAKVPVGMRAAWLAEVQKMIKDFEQLGDKGKEAVNMLVQSMQSLNLNTLMGQLQGLGPKLQAIAGGGNLAYKPGADISQMRAKMGDALASQVQAAVEATAQKMGVDPALVYAIMGHESGFNAAAFNPAGGGLGAAGLGQFRSGTAQAVLSRMGMPGLSGPEAMQQAMDPAKAAEMVTTYVRMIQEDCERAGKEANLWNVLFAYRGGAAIPQAEMQSYFDSVSKGMAKFQKGGMALVTEQDLETTKKNLELEVKAVEEKQKAGIIGAVAAAQQKGALEQQIAMTTVQITEAKLAEAQKHGTAEHVNALREQLKQEQAVAVAGAQATAIEVGKIERDELLKRQEAKLKAAQEEAKLAEVAVKKQIEDDNVARRNLEASYNSRKMSAQAYYSAVAALDQKDLQLQLAVLNKEKAAVEDLIKDRKAAQAAQPAGGSQQEQLAMQKQVDEAVKLQAELTEKINGVQGKYNESLAKTDEELKKQEESVIRRGLVEAQISIMTGPVASQAAQMVQLLEKQTEQKQKFTDLLAHEVQLNKQNSNYGITQEQSDAYMNQLNLIQKAQQLQVQMGQEVKQWADDITNGISQFVDSLQRGNETLSQAANKLFTSLFKDTLKPMFDQLNQFLQDMFKQLGQTVGAGVANAIMGILAIVGMMFTSGSNKSSFTAGNIQSNVSPAEAERGVIAGATTIPIADISQSLEEALVDTNGILLQIEQNTRGGTGGGGGQAGGVQLTVNIPNWQATLQAAVLQIMQTYFNSYLVHGAPA